jgi:hypothetical protein
MLRYGRRHYWFDEGYPKWYDGPERLSESEEHYSGALAFGFSETFGLDHLAFDIQAGISFKEKFFHAVYAQEEGTYADDHQAWYVLPRLGFSFCWFFLR